MIVLLEESPRVQHNEEECKEDGNVKEEETVRMKLNRRRESRDEAD